MKRSEMLKIIEDIIDHGMHLGVSFEQIAENILHIQTKEGMLPPFNGDRESLNYNEKFIIQREWEPEDES